VYLVGLNTSSRVYSIFNLVTSNRWFQGVQGFRGDSSLYMVGQLKVGVQYRDFRVVEHNGAIVFEVGLVHGFVGPR
jgi:hypothetical protein